MGTVLKVCSWCRASMGTVEGDFDLKFPVTHGICESCARAVSEGAEQKPFQEFLDGLGVPVLVVNDDALVLAANRQVKDLLGRESPRILGHRLGDVIECPSARLAGGCGKSVHCRSCAIRNAVLKTHRTGDGCFRVPAYADSQIGSKVKTLSMKITTEKVGACVLLWIDELSERERREVD